MKDTYSLFMAQIQVLIFYGKIMLFVLKKTEDKGHKGKPSSWRLKQKKGFGLQTGFGTETQKNKKRGKIPPWLDESIIITNVSTNLIGMSFYPVILINF